MNKSTQHIISSFFLLVYIPVALSLTYLHQHNTYLGDHADKIEAVDGTESAVSFNAHISCAICHFLSSQETKNLTELNCQRSITSLIYDVNERSAFNSYDDLFSQRAPPFLI